MGGRLTPERIRNFEALMPYWTQPRVSIARNLCDAYRNDAIVMAYASFSSARLGPPRVVGWWRACRSLVVEAMSFPDLHSVQRSHQTVLSLLRVAV